MSRRPLSAFVLAASLLALRAWAQSTTKPLNLTLPPSDLPAPAGTTGKPTTAAPGVYYGDTSGRTADDDTVATPACDDATVNQPQLHGSVSTGVIAGNRVDGNYQGGTVNISKRFGSCDHPTGGVSFSIGASTGHFHGH